jgi:hypothetical protein
MIGIICFLPSCNDCKGVNAGYLIPIGSQLKKYSFEPGSYWVYQDSVSGTIDSQSVYYYTAQNHFQIDAAYGTNGVQDCPIYGDVFSMSAASFWNGIPHDSIFWSNNNHGYTANAINISYTIGQQYYYGFDINGIDTLTNFSVSGHTYSQVHLNNSYPNALIYQVDNVGIIKYVFNDTINGQHTWNLLRYHVINP